MFRRPTGPAGRGPHRPIQDSDYDPHALPGIKAVGGRVLPPDFLARMEAAREHEPTPVSFVQQMRERKRHDGTT